MTPYELMMASEEAIETAKRYKPLVEQGVIGEYNATVDAFERARAREVEEYHKEVASWDTGKLKEQMDFTRAMLENALQSDDPAAEIQQLKQEAEATGDRHRIRGTLEMLRTAVSKMPTDDLDKRRVINLVAKEAEGALKELRRSPGMVEAHDQAVDAFGKVLAQEKHMEEAERVIGPSGPIYSAKLRVKIDPQRGIIVLPADDPQLHQGEHFEQLRARLQERE
jgi:hypothetical protein